MKVKTIPLADAIAALKTADAALQAAKTNKEKRAAALAFAKAERDARSAKKKESESSILDSLK